MNSKNIFVSIIFLLILSSCSLWKANEWNSYKTTLEIHDQLGKPLAGIRVEALARHDKLSNESGRSNLFFTKTGLHIVTLRSSNTSTKQITIKIPDDADKIIVVTVELK